MATEEEDVESIVPTDEVPQVELDDKALFEESEKEEAPKEEVEAQPEETEEAKESRERDEKGRFKAKEAEEQEQHHRIPLRELLDEREKRQQIQAQFEAMQQQMAQRQAWEQQQQTAEQQQAVDIFEHPEWYQQQFAAMPQMIQQQVNQRLAMMEWKLKGDYSLDRARTTDPEKFNAAWDALERRTYGGDPTWRQQVLSSPDPGGTLLSLFKRETVTQKVGDDPDVFLQNALEEKLNDPEFLAHALERARDMAKAQPRKVSSSTPSINKAGGLSPQRGGNSSMDDATLWEETMR